MGQVPKRIPHSVCLKMYNVYKPSHTALALLSVSELQPHVVPKGAGYQPVSKMQLAAAIGCGTHTAAAGTCLAYSHLHKTAVSCDGYL
jgi:hypothetical protein